MGRAAGRARAHLSRARSWVGRVQQGSMLSARTLAGVGLARGRGGGGGGRGGGGGGGGGGGSWRCFRMSLCDPWGMNESEDVRQRRAIFSGALRHRRGNRPRAGAVRNRSERGAVRLPGQVGDLTQ